MSQRRRWSEQDARIVLEMVSAHGPDLTTVAAALGVSYAQVQNYAAKVLGRRYRDAVTHYEARVRAQAEIAPPQVRRQDVRDALAFPPAPFAVAIPRPTKPIRAKKWMTAVIYGDTHVPFQDHDTLNAVFGILRDAAPDVVLHVGDLVDCWQVSRFDKDPTRSDDLQANIDEARAHLHQVAQIAPQARRVLLEGNHEQRLTRAIWQMDGAQREFARLREFQKALTWPNLLQLDAIGWEWVGEREQTRTEILPKIITKHGSVVRKWSGWSAKGEWEKYGASGVSGHTHRLGWFVHRDHNGRANWVETGCTCKLDAPYGNDFDWNPGAVVMTWSADRIIQNVEFVSIREGRTIWRDREYQPPKGKRAA